VERPDSNLPLGILISVGVMIPIYVIVGVTPPDILQSSLTPMADATKQILGVPAKIGITNVALIAFRESEVESYDPAFENPGYP